MQFHKNVLKLEDSILGFYKSEKEINYIDAQMSPNLSAFRKNVKGSMYKMVFLRANSGMEYYRTVYTFEEAFGWLGGILGILYSFLQTIFIPFTKDQLTYKVASKTRMGKLLAFDSFRFRCLKSLNNICSCCFSC